MSQPAGQLQNSLLIKRKPLSDRPYTPTQVLAWLDHIGYLKLEPQITEDNVLQAIDLSLKTLTILCRLSIVAFLYEDTQLHYTAKHLLDVSFQGLYQRMVVDQHGGSWCFGMNSLLLGMLRSLGFRAYAGAGRVNQSMSPSQKPVYTSLAHMVIFVQLHDDDLTTYFVDVGFGGSGLTRPILLAEGQEVMGTTPTERHRLTRGVRGDSSVGSAEWQLEVRHIKPSSSAPLSLSHLIMPSDSWRILYRFLENEFFEQDILDGSNLVCCRQDGLFKNKVVCAKCFWLDHDLKNQLDEPDNVEEVYIGRMTLEAKEIRKHFGSRTEVVAHLETEEERVAALTSMFGLVMKPDDIVHIRGRIAEI